MIPVFRYKNLQHDFPFDIKFADHKPYYKMTDYHWHNYLEISYVKQGSGRYYIDNKSFDVEQGDIIVINNIEPHFMEVYPPVNMIQPVLMFDPGLIWSGEKDFFDRQYLKPFFERSTSFSNKIDSRSEYGNEIFKLLNDIEKEYISKIMGFELMIKAKLLQIITLLIRFFTNEDDDALQSKLKHKKLKRLENVFEYINTHYEKKITLKDLANTSFMSPNYFCVYFKDVTGFSPIEYINKVRVIKAMEILKTSDRSIFNVYCDCGFTNLSNFNKTFKKYTDLSPSQYRKGI